MSNTLAIAATTTALRNLLIDGVPKRDADLNDLEVTTRTPDAARTGLSGASLNLFLYQTVVNAAWSNTDMPRQVKPGESGQAPLALNLRYLVTAYGREQVDQDAVSHRVLGAGMSVLHDHPLLGADEIRSAVTGNDLADQIERIRITPLPLSVDEMSKLWSAFQSQYRVSTAYEVTVVLIDSLRPASAPLPVLRRGQDDRGVMAVTGPAPVLREVKPPNHQPAAALGTNLVVLGDNLGTTDTTVRFASFAPDPPPVVVLRRQPPQVGEPADLFTVRLPGRAEDPDAFGRWVPGFYTVSAVVDRPGVPPLLSNEVPFALAPAVTVDPNSTGNVPVIPGDTLTVTCAPRVRSAQRILLLFGDRQLAPTGISNPVPGSAAFNDTPTTVTFLVPQVDPGLYVVRLRVDGADSLPVVFTGVPARPAFDPAQQVMVS
jgi:hypothetical protein